MTDVKQNIRLKLLKERKDLTQKYRASHALKLVDKLLPFCLEFSKKTIHTFIPFRNEPDLLPLLDALLQHNFEIIAPKTLKHGVMEHYKYNGRACIKNGLYKTPYPATGQLYNGGLSIILVPGLAFDSYGRRLGYGGGYYDQFLHQHPESVKIGIVYPFQLQEEIPIEPHDALVDWVFTNDLQKALK